MALLELIKTWQLSHQCNGLSLSSVGSYSPHLTLLWPAGTPLVSLRHESGFYSVVPHRSHIGDPHSSHFDFSSFELPLNLVHLFNDRKLEILRETYRSYAIAPERCKTFIQLFACFPNGSSFVGNFHFHFDCFPNGSSFVRNLIFDKLLLNIYIKDFLRKEKMIHHNKNYNWQRYS